MALMRERETEGEGGIDRKKILEEKEGLINFNFTLEKLVILII